MTAQELKNSILQHAVQGKLVPQNPTDEPASVLLERIKGGKTLAPITEDEIPFEIPESWAWIHLTDICEVSTGKHDANHAKENGQFRFYTCAFEHSMCNTSRFHGECLILPGNGANVGEVFYYQGEFDA